MKNMIKLIGIIALVAVIEFSMAACGDDSGGGGNVLPAAKGYLTINGLEEYNGKYVFVITFKPVHLFGLVEEGKDDPKNYYQKLAAISDGEAVVPMYKVNDADSTVIAYEGNDTNLSLDVEIYNEVSGKGEAVVERKLNTSFSNGNATVSWL
ncbi:MAG: hypothetical protein LBI04_00460 [Treponema sp.]|nr:hypothetical protein [Treponema sp.]